MNTTLKIKITREVLERSMWCGTEKAEIGNITENCAIALAIRDIFPRAVVTRVQIVPFMLDNDWGNRIELPQEASDFIRVFDELAHSPEKRLLLPPFDFTIEVPQSVIDSINIDDFHRCGTVELV